MARHPSASRKLLYGSLLLACLAAVFLVTAAGGFDERRGEANVLRIGSSGSLAASADPARDKAAIESLESFIKSETGMDSKIFRHKSWHEVADKMEGGELQLGVFLGYEFAWAAEKRGRLKPLAIA